MRMRDFSAEEVSEVKNQVLFESEKGDPELGSEMVKLVAEIFPSPESAQRFFDDLRASLETSADTTAVVRQYRGFLEGLRGDTRKISLLNTLTDQYTASHASGLDRAHVIHELFTSPVLTAQLLEYWPKARK